MSWQDSTMLRPLIGLGILAGMRSVTPLAVLSQSLARQPLSSQSQIVELFRSDTTAKALALAAAAELIADKLPQMPSRTIPPVLLGRVLMGSSAGALLGLSRNQTPWVGAIGGGLVALTSSFGAYYLRLFFGSVLHIPQPLDGIAEDDLVLLGVLWLFRELENAPTQYAPLAYET